MACAAANLALNHPCDLTPEPNYPGCRSDSDPRDLTDGDLCPAAEYPIWIQPQAVGWQHVTQPIAISVDLGAEVSIRQVKLFLAGGVNDVLWPRIVDVEVSADGQEFHTLGCLSALSINRYPAPDSGYRRLTLDASFRPANARFVRLRVLPGGPYFFTEELEIYGTSDLVASPPEQLPVASDDETFVSGVSSRVTKNCIRRRLELDLASQAAQLAAHPEFSGELLPELRRLENTVGGVTFSGDPDQFRAVTPMHPLQTEILQLHAKILRKLGYPEVTFWSQDRFAPLSPYAIPPAKDSLTEIKTAMMNGEKRGVVIQFTNAGENAQEVVLRASGVPAELFAVDFVDSNALQTEAIALTPLWERVSVPAGMTRQFYLRLNPENLEPGKHIFPLRFEWGDRQTREISLLLDIARGHLPERPTLSTGWWDYLDFGHRTTSGGLSQDQSAAALALERESGVDTTFAEHGIGTVNHPEQIPLDSTGSLAQPLDFSAFDRWVAQWPDARHYVVFMALSATTKFGDAEPGTPRFQRAVAEWARQWERHLTSNGPAPERVILQLLDEPHDKLTYQRTREWAEAIRSGSDRIQLYCNPLQFPKAGASVFDRIDILSPLADTLRNAAPAEQAIWEQQLEAGKALWIYNCHAGPFNATPWYYRRQPWAGFKRGATGSFFWSLGDTGGNSNGWNQYLTGTIYYAPLLIDNNGLTITKHWEAMREGIADYEYLVLLRQLIEQTRQLHPEDAAAAEVALTAAVSRVDAGWSDSAGTELAEQERLNLLQWINQLTQP